MTKQPMKATTLRDILTFVIIASLVIAGVGFYFGLQWIKPYAAEVSQMIANASASGQDEIPTNSLESEIASQQELIVKANSLYTSSLSYQTTAINDIDRYARITGVTVAKYDFAAAAAPAPATQSTPATPSATVGPVTTITATLGSPLPYSRLLQFMYLIEHSIPKMQITGINIGREATGGNTVTTDPLTIQVYTR